MPACLSHLFERLLGYAGDCLDNTPPDNSRVVPLSSLASDGELAGDDVRRLAGFRVGVDQQEPGGFFRTQTRMYAKILYTHARVAEEKAQ